MSFFYYNYYDEEEEKIEVISEDIPEGWTTKPQTTPTPPELRRLQVTTLLVVCAIGLLMVMCLCICMCYNNERLLNQMPWRRCRERRTGRSRSKRRGLFGLPGPFSSRGDPTLSTMMGQGILMPGLYTVAAKRPRPSIVPVFSPQGEAANAPVTSNISPTSKPRIKPQGSGLKGGGLLVSPDTLQGVLSTGSSPISSQSNLAPDVEPIESDVSSVVSATMATPDMSINEQHKDISENPLADLDTEEKEIDTKYRYSKKYTKPQNRRGTASSTTIDLEQGTLNTEMTCLGGRI